MRRVAVGAGRAASPAGRGGWAGSTRVADQRSAPDETGNPTQAWSLKVHVMLVVVALTAAAPSLVLVAASAGHLTWLSWAAVATGGVLAGVATGVVLADAARQPDGEGMTTEGKGRLA
jgi:hypothetical protein